MTPPMTPREKVAEIIKEMVSGPHFTDTSHFVAMEQDRFAAADAILTALASGSGDHAELARLAEAATPGPWVCKEGSTSYPECDDKDFWSVVLSPAGKEIVTLHERYASKSDDRGDYDFDAAFIAAANPVTVLALLAENAALRAERDALDLALGVSKMMVNDQDQRATEAERKLAEAVDDERARGQVIIDERDKWIVELISERDEARAILRDAVSEAVPDAMIFAGHTDARRYSIALDDLRNWTARARTFLSKEAERG